ncbi:MAG TPA: DUF4124 domain-containing protein [Usitatibacter sp.]|nr:DUF4124 domain-containing protein [Usitatibacter sp.]
MQARPSLPHAWRNARFVLPALALALAAQGAGATVLYKSIGPKGVIQFSDTPPEQGVIVEERVVSDAPRDGRPIVGVQGYAPMLAFENPLENVAGGDAFDEALARANERVDLAEHQLALARNDTWSPREGLRLSSAHRTPADDERIAFYRRNLAAARANLLALLERRMPMATDIVYPAAERRGPGVREVAAR